MTDPDVITEARALLEQNVWTSGGCAYCGLAFGQLAHESGCVVTLVERLLAHCAAQEAQIAALTRETEPLTAWVTGETVAERDAAFLRMYAAKLLDGTARAWEIPNTVASTLQDIAKRRVAAEAQIAALRQELAAR